MGENMKNNEGYIHKVDFEEDHNVDDCVLMMGRRCTLALVFCTRPSCSTECIQLSDESTNCNVGSIFLRYLPTSGSLSG